MVTSESERVQSSPAASVERGRKGFHHRRKLRRNRLAAKSGALFRFATPSTS